MNSIPTNFKIIITTLFLSLSFSANANNGAFQQSIQSSFQEQSGVGGSNAVFGKTGALKNIRGYVGGGNGHLRIPNKKLRLYVGNFVPPTLSSSCGKVSWSSGSMSFFKGDNGRALMQALEDIPSAALTYAFEMALEAMCSTCKNVMKDIQAVMNSLNADLGNSCNVATSIVKGIGAREDGDDTADIFGKILDKADGSYMSKADAAKSKFNTAYASLSSNSKAAVDELKNAGEFPWLDPRDWSNLQDSGFASTQKKTSSDQEQDKLTEDTVSGKNNKQLGFPGNIVFNALSGNNGLTTLLVGNTTVNETELKNAIISITGTKYIGKKADATGKIDATKDVDRVPYESLINLTQLIEGSGSGANDTTTLWKCSGVDADTLCPLMTKYESKVVGFKKIMDELWLGVPDDSTKPGLINKLVEPDTYCQGDKKSCLSMAEFRSLDELGAVSSTLLRRIMSFKTAVLARRFFEDSRDYYTNIMAYEYAKGVIVLSIKEIMNLKKKKANSIPADHLTWYEKEITELLKRSDQIHMEFSTRKTVIETQTKNIADSFNSQIEFERSVNR